MNRPDDLDALVEAWMTNDGIGPIRPEVVRSAVEEARTLPQRRGRLARWRSERLTSPVAWAARAAALTMLVVAGLAVVRPGGLLPGGVGSTPVTALATASPAPSSVAATPAPSVAAPEPPLGLAIVGVDGTVQQELGMPQDAWMPDLSADGRLMVFLTSDDQVAECGSCSSPRRPAAVVPGEARGAFIYPLGPDGSLPPIDDLNQPVISPHGSMIAFQGVTGPERNRDIWAGPLVRGDHTWGAPLVRLTDDPAWDEFPAWSPDGRTIYYSSSGTDPLDDSGFSATQDIWSVPATGGTPTRLTTMEGADTMPDVRKDGRVAWWHETEIWTMAPDGSDQRLLLNVDGGPTFNPVWSPDGTRIALLQYDPTGRAPARPDLGRSISYPLLKVLIVDVATAAVTDTGVRVASDVNPVSWTPDGQALLINRFDGGTRP
ncbi:MAG: hypothetical protein U0869_07915 [Chloroflexota bacterium]